MAETRDQFFLHGISNYYRQLLITKLDFRCSYVCFLSILLDMSIVEFLLLRGPYIDSLFLPQFAISSVIIVVCTMDNLFKYSDKSLVFTYFFLFGLSAITLSFLISTFFSRAKTAVAVGTLSFLGAFFPYYSVNDQAVSMLVLWFEQALSFPSSKFIFYKVLIDINVVTSGY